MPVSIPILIEFARSMVSARKEVAMRELASFGRWLKLRRIALELTQAELAALVGCAEITIRKIEADERRPSQQIAELLARHLNLAPAERAGFIDAAQGALSPIRLAPPTQATAPTYQRGYLPVPPTPLIGRAREVLALRARLGHDGVRLLTLTGPGGVGKTRLAIQAATELRDEFADGAWFVNLAPIDDPALVADTIAQALAVREHAGVPLSASLASHLHARELLLLLDNCEQVLAAAPLVAELLAAAPGLMVLATSRAALRLSGEHEFVVPPLDVPPLPSASFHTSGVRESHAAGTSRTPAPRVGEGAADLLRYPAVELFVARAQVARPDFMLTSENAPAVAEICVRLDGLPLALQLAAARSKLFSPQALVARLDRRLNILTMGSRDLPARQQTLRDAIAWSYDLLGADEQVLFRRLAVFVGGWTLDAAEAVCADSATIQQPTTNSQPILDGLTALLDQSLLYQEEVYGEPRFTMLETIREYALEQLEAHGETAVLRERHVRYFLALVERAEPELQRAAAADWLDRLAAERDNLRAALEWGRTAPSGAGVAVATRLAGALWHYWELRGGPREARAQLAAILARAPSETAAQQAVRAKALGAAGDLAANYDDFAAARTYYEESLALFRALGNTHGSAMALFRQGILASCAREPAMECAYYEESLLLFRALEDTWGIASALFRLGSSACWGGDFARATAYLQESLALFDALGDTSNRAPNLCMLGIVAWFEGEYTRAESLLEQGLALAQQVGMQYVIAIGLGQLGRLALARGEYAQAAVLLEQSLALAQEAEDRIMAAFALRALGMVACRQGAFDRADALHREALGLYQERNDRWGIVECLEGLAATACGQGAQSQHEVEATQHSTRTVRLLGAAAALRAILVRPISPVDREDVGRVTSAARGVLGEALFVAAWDAGQTMPLERAIAYAFGEGD
jgi:predicted ATPase/transcriptional regulator with XRE-family HTH domain